VGEHLLSMRNRSRRERSGTLLEWQRPLGPGIAARAHFFHACLETLKADCLRGANVVVTFLCCFHRNSLDFDINSGRPEGLRYTALFDLSPHGSSISHHTAVFQSPATPI
jgi:hypothetical protein